MDADPKSELLRDAIRDHIKAFAWEPADLVGVDQSKIPETNIAFDIKLKPEFLNASIYQRDRKYSQLEHQVMDEYYGNLLILGFIELAAPGTPHALTTVIAPKKAEDGTWVDTRVCTNTVPLNEAAFLDRYQTSTLDEIFQSMSGAEIFSCIDCKSGYHQLANTEATKKLLSFHWRSKLYSWTRMPFGPASAPPIGNASLIAFFAPWKVFAYATWMILSSIVVPIQKTAYQLWKFMPSICAKYLAKWKKLSCEPTMAKLLLAQLTVATLAS